MKAEIITIGTEITTGDTLNTNAQYLSKELLSLGIETFYQTSVNDDKNRMKEVFKIAANRADLIITTGGLGPTKDDMTKEVWAEFLKLELIDDENMKEEIREKFIFKNKRIPENNYKQALKIKGSKFIHNAVGTAPGIYLEYDDKTIILLPGPPRELKVMFEREVKKLLKGEKQNIIAQSINVTGIGESQVETDIIDLIEKYETLEIATFGRLRNVEIRALGRGEDLYKIEKEMEEFISEVEKRFKDNIYSYNDTSIVSIVYDKLVHKNLTISFAESCTGGLVSGKLTRLPGASKVLDSSYVTYSNGAKVRVLNVKESTIKNHGAVSLETGQEMVKGLLKVSKADIGVSITGLLGPESDESNKPVGLVYICVSDGKKDLCKKYDFTGDRNILQDRVVQSVYFQIHDFIKKYY